MWSITSRYWPGGVNWEIATCRDRCAVVFITDSDILKHFFVICTQFCKYNGLYKTIIRSHTSTTRRHSASTDIFLLLPISLVRWRHCTKYFSVTYSCNDLDFEARITEYWIITWIPRHRRHRLNGHNWRIWYDELLNYSKIKLPWMAWLVAISSMF